MKLMPFVLFLIGCLGCFGEEWKPLFNGKDFTGWETYLSKPTATIQVEGLDRDSKGEYTKPLGVNRDPFHAFSYVQLDGQPVVRIVGEIAGGISTLASYSNFHLRLQFKWGALRPGQGSLRNSGLLYHAHGQHGSGNGRWLPSHQFQIQNGFCGDYVAMGDGVALIPAKKTDEKHFVFDPTAPSIAFSNQAPDPTRCGKRGKPEQPDGEWNTLELYCLDDQAVHLVNGEVVLRATSRVRAGDGSLAPLKEGRLQLQAEGWEIFYRHLEICPISELPPELGK